jgi:hypothetical protein
MMLDSLVETTKKDLKQISKREARLNSQSSEKVILFGSQTK